MLFSILRLVFSLKGEFALHIILKHTNKMPLTLYLQVRAAVRIDDTHAALLFKLPSAAQVPVLWALVTPAGKSSEDTGSCWEASAGLRRLSSGSPACWEFAC